MNRVKKIWKFFTSSKKAAVGSLLLLALLVVTAFPTFFAPYDPSAEEYIPRQGPSISHWLGTTAFGQDILSQVIVGTRQSMLIALVVGLFCTILSVLVGVSAAYFGGAIDDFLAMATDVILVIPTFPLIIVITAYAKANNFWLMVLVLVITGWSYGARQLRVQALSFRNRDFLQSAKARGESSWYVIIFEMLPPMTSLIVANFLGAALYAVLAAAALQFVGLGNINTQSWGTMLYWAQNNEALATGMPLWALAPGIAIAVLGTSLALLNYAFDELANPALRPIRTLKLSKLSKLVGNKS